MKIRISAALLVAGMALPAIAQTTGVSHPEQIPITTTPDAPQQPVYVAPAPEPLPPAAPVITASEALGPASAALPASPAAAAAAASQQASGVPVSRQGSAYGIALPQPVTSDASGSPAVSAAPATTPTASGTSSNGLLIVLGVLLVAVAIGVGTLVIYQRRR